MTQRFFVARDARISLDEHGWLLRPDGEYAEAYNPDLRHWDQVSHLPVVIILGEPGIGKSTVLADAYQLDATTNGAAVRICDLGTYSDQAALAQDLFGPDGPIQEKAGEQVTTLYLDSLDECKISIPTIERYLRDKLQRVPSDRLRLRIACRTAVWSTVLEQFLTSKWGDRAVAVLELAPLRIQDVREIAEQRGQNPTRFLEQIITQNVGSLAARPGTLNLLLRIFAQSGTLPTSRFELYRIGCRALLAEGNPNRRESGRTGRLSTEQRISLASCIAAVSMFANRGMISLQVPVAPDSNLICPVDLRVSSVRHEGPHQQNNEESDFQEVMDTGVFTSRGSDRFGWAHQTFAEFLAAHYLHEHELTTDQAHSLFTNISDPERRIAPQLWETAAWYSVTNPEFLAWLLEKEPELVLRSDIQLSDPGLCERAIQSILELADDNRYFDTEMWTRRRYARLRHHRLASQLRPYILDRSHGLITRRIAMDIAEACKLEELSNLLADVALDTNEQYPLRKNAAYAVQYIGEASARKRMRSLLKDAHDKDEELKGIAIRCLWPDFMSSDELFATLSPPRNEHFIGSYITLFNEIRIKDLQAPDCLDALKWVRNLDRQQLQNYSMGEFARAIMAHALEYLDNPTVSDAFAYTAWHLLKLHDSIFSRRWGSGKRSDCLEDARRRRKVALTLIRRCGKPGDDGFYLFHREEHLIRDEDLSWLLDLTGADSEPAADTCARLLGYRLQYAVPLEIFNLILDRAATLAAQGKPSLKDALSWLLEPTALDSQEAEDARERIRQLEELQERSRVPRYPPISEHLNEALHRCEAGESAHWVQVVTALSRENDDSPPIWSNDNIFETPGWLAASPELRARIRSAAITFLLHSPAPADDLTRRTSYRLSELAGIAALMLAIFSPDHEPFDLPAEAWQKLCRPIAVTLMRDKESVQWKEILEMAHCNAADALFTAFQERLSFEIESGSGFHIAEKLAFVWNERYETLLLAVAQTTSGNRNHLRDVLEFLFEKDVEHMDSLCREAVHATLHDDNVELAAVYASTYLRHHPALAWNDTWTWMESNAEFGQAVVLKLAGFRDSTRALDLPEAHLADFYLWLETVFPQAEDPEGDGWVSPRHEVATLRQEILGRLKNCGTQAALEALDRIIATFPDALWLRSLSIEAEKVARSATWQPLTPAELIEFVESANSILVRDERELTNAIEQSLNRLQARLKGHGGVAPLATALWDETSRRPKREVRISEIISSHLHDDLKNAGVIANREVEIRNRQGRGIGESVDLMVSCFCPDAESRTHIASVVVEVKGSWNPNLYDDMTAQLSNRYLDGVNLRHGVYVVGYFPSDLWDDADYRKTIALKNTNGEIETLRYRLIEKAQPGLKGAGTVIPFVLDFSY